MTATATATTLEDRTARARIRDAAIRCIADEGIRGATTRKIAAAAGVSPGLVIHHFGSMAGLRRACDEHVIAAVRQAKEAAVAAGPSLDPLAGLRDGQMPGLAAYLSRVLVEDSPEVARLVDGLVADAEAYMALGVDTGILKPTDDHRSRAAVLALWSLGSLVLNEHARRLLGADLTDRDAAVSPGMRHYIRTVLDILSDGIYTPEFAAATRHALEKEDR